MASNLFFLVLLLIPLSTTSRPSEISAVATAADEAADLPCVKELLPCQPYLHATKPPAQCCLPLLSAIEKEAACLCAVFYSGPILKALNLSQEEALVLPRNCGGNLPDIGTCKNGGSVDGPMPSLPTAPLPPQAAKRPPPANGPSPSHAPSIRNSVGLPILAGGKPYVMILLLIYCSCPLFSLYEVFSALIVSVQICP